jgi:ubiquinone/menaquinone biosynthesis C-methylase UbiE
VSKSTIPASQWKEEAAQVFEADAQHYATGREDYHWYQTQLKFMTNALAGKTGRVLDLGCAAGVEIAALRHAGFTVLGVDYVHRMLLASKRRLANDPTVSFTRADAEYLPFRDASFDHVVCLGVLEYLPSYSRTIAEVHRVLRSDGIAVVALPSRTSLFHITRTIEKAILSPLWRAGKRMLGKASPRTVPAHHRNTCIPSKFLDEMERSGLHPIDYASTAFMLAPLDRLWPTAEERFAMAFERFGRTPLLRWMGSQFMVVARKRADPSLHSF